jgi:riboflavin kinase/FMN adenylyltransferase
LKVLHDIKDFNPSKPVWLTQGTFDGVHIGHQKILKQVISEAKNAGGLSVLLTFYPHPRLVLYPDNNELKLLTTIEEKAKFVGDLGLDYLIIMPFTKELSRLKSEEFVRDILVEKLKVSKLIIGYDHRFGRNREGGIKEMQLYAEAFGFNLEEISAQDIEQSIVSSTKIRNSLLNGNVEIAASYLGRSYCVNGTVEKGMQRGRTIGFPTANIRVNSSFKLVPKNGVYAVWVRLGKNKYAGMLNIGDNPTFENKNWSIEVYIFDFAEDIYGLEISVEFIKKSRGEIKFEGIKELTEQLKEDEKRIREILEV